METVRLTTVRIDELAGVVRRLMGDQNPSQRGRALEHCPVVDPERAYELNGRDVVATFAQRTDQM